MLPIRLHIFALTLAGFLAASLFAPSCRAADGYLMERVGGDHIRLTTQTQQPAWGQSYTQQETGIVETRLTDVARTANKWSSNPMGYDRKPDAKPGHGIGQGLTNGYSRYSNVSRDNKYFIAYGTSQLGCLYRMADFNFLGVLLGQPTYKIGAEYSEVRWDRSGEPGTSPMIHFFGERELHEENVEQGAASDRVIFNLPHLWVHKGDGDWDNSMRYVACAMAETPDIKDPVTHHTVKREVDIVQCYDRKENRLLPGIARYDIGRVDLNGVDVSPDGKWMTAETDFYRIEDLRKNIVAPRRGAIAGGHGGWAWKDGRSVWVWQESADDYISYFDPEKNEVHQVMKMDELGWNQGLHIGSIKNPALDGWALVSTYGPRGKPLANQIFMLELKPLNKAPHPAYFAKKPGDAQKAAYAAWQAGWVPKEQRARIWRLGSSNCMKYVNRHDMTGYYGEAFASINWDGTMVLWGSNWWATDNLELYRLSLPGDWHEKLGKPE